MSNSSGHSPVGASPSNPIPVRSSLANRFYEPIILLDSLNTAWEKNQASRAQDTALDPAEPAEAAFHRFVNKLGHLCDSEQGGKTVTAFVVLKSPDRIQYRFASNRQREKSLIRAKDFVTQILQILGRKETDGIQNITLHILRKVLSFNRPRVQVYLESLKKYSSIVIRSCTRDGKDDSVPIAKKLDELQELLRFSDDESLEDEAFSLHSERLINAIDQLYHSEVNELILNKSNEGRMTESEDWCELRHATGRLLSYLQAVKVLISTRKRWPELFEEGFEVDFVASSRPAKRPFGEGKIKLMTVEKIIGRMTSDPELMKIHKARAQELEKFGLDETVREHASFRPIVHAEVLLLESLERDGITNPSRFFGMYKYIGCSKPTCRLCDYYFASHASGVEVRPSHRNLYRGWRMPDVYSEQGPTAVKRREDIMNKILDRIRKDTFRTMSDKVPERKSHDSNTEPTYPIDSIRSRQPEDVEHLERMLEMSNIGGSGEEVLSRSSTRTSFGESEFLASENEDEGERMGA